MKAFCLLFVVILGLSGCSRFSKNARSERAYQKYVQRSQNARFNQGMKILKQQQKQTKMPPLRDSPPPVEQQRAEAPPPDNQ
jgi:uncharacterized lipoprotein